ncbi:RNA recognition motif domain-containing protein [Candidatus Marithrix sp. Canyon 246]|uniref:RNA recognition motif domain-containing protein n=2 Tax=Candidatus Marithrix sp. Canyon 246 TaxID=1827136 RepID=UPI00209B594B|nr:RNA-binding protein [Candidatus Marithrix sp. Canyon 246]
MGKNRSYMLCFESCCKSTVVNFFEKHIGRENMRKTIFYILSLCSLLCILPAAYGMNIYVGNLPHSMTDSELKKLFAEYGEVSIASVITYKKSGQSRDFGFLEMPNQAEGQKAINSLNGSSLKGRNIKVNQAKPRNDRPQRRYRY